MKQTLSKLLNHFTYRQRFILWAILFWMTAAIPAYWVFKTGNLLTIFADSQLRGSQFQQVLGQLLNVVLQNQITTLSQKSDNEINQAKLQRELNAKLAQLESLKQKNQEVLQGSYFFGNYYLPNQLDISLLRKEMSELFTSREKNLDEKQQVYTRMTSLIQENIVISGFLFKLNLHADPLLNHLTKEMLFVFPRQQILLANFFYLIKKMEEKKELTKGFYSEYLAKKSELRKSLETNFTRLNSLYQLYEDTYPYLSASDYKADRLRRSYQQTGNRLLLLLSSPEKNAQDLREVFLKMLSISNQMQEIILTMFINVRLEKVYSYRWKVNWGIFIFCIGSLIVSFFALFRVLTRHFFQLYCYLEELAQGRFSSSIPPVNVDEVGEIAQSFHHMANSIENVIIELSNLGRQLSEFINKIAINTNNQKNYIFEQDESLQTLETTTKRLSSKTNELASMMDSFTQDSQEILIADTSRSGLALMQDKMSQLAKASSNILANLMIVNEKVTSTGNLIIFMTKVSEQAHLLSLNAAIESLNIGKHKQTFSDITYKIERFAENSAQSTNAIRKIIQDMSSSVIIGKNTTDICVKEINAGANRLISVSHQVSSISQYGKEQTKKFQLVNLMMQKQAELTEDMMESIIQLRKTVDGNSQLVHALNKAIEILIKTSKENSQVLKQFFH